MSVMPNIKTLWPGSTFSPEIGDLPVHGVGEDHGEGHALRRLVRGVPEHQALGARWYHRLPLDVENGDITRGVLGWTEESTIKRLVYCSYCRAMVS